MRGDRRRPGICILALITSVMLPSPVGAAQIIPERITGTVTLKGDLALPVTTTVQKEGVLILEAGTSVRAAPGVSLEVHGRLEITGTARDPVVITSAGPEPWNGISYYQGSKGGIRQLEITGARVGLGMIASKVTIEDTKVSGAEKGIHLIKEANAVISRCLLDANKVGLVVEMRSVGSVRGCAFVKNEAGVGIGSGGMIDVAGNRFKENQIGVRVFQRFPGKISGNLFEGNRVGVRLEQNGPDTVIEKNRFTGSGEAAVQALSYTSPTISNNFMSGGRYGVMAYQFSSPRIMDNRIEGMQEAIHLNKKSVSIITGNVISGSKVGLFLDFSSYPHARGNRFEGNDLHVKLGRFQSAHWESAAGSKKIVMQTAAQVKSRNPRLAGAPEEFPEAVDLTGNWWDENTASQMETGENTGNVSTIFDGHDLPEVSYSGFGDEKYRVDKVVYLPRLESPPENSGLQGWQGGKDELGF